MVRLRKEAAAEAPSSHNGVAAVSLAASAPRPGRSEPTDREALSRKQSSSSRFQLPALRDGPAQFGLVVALYWALSSLGHLLVNAWAHDQLASIAKQNESTTDLVLLAAWKLFGLALGWFGDYDGYDLAALALLSHGPAAYLTSVFYGLDILNAGSLLGVEVASTFLPFVLLRQPSGAHSAAPGVPNREIVVDKDIQVLTSLQAGLVYSIVIFLASRYILPTTLVLYFDGIPTIRPAAEATFPGFDNPVLQVLSLLFGIAARSLIFTPLVTTPPTAQDQENAEFDPVSATLGETVAWNLWGYTTQTKVSIKRTAAAMLFAAIGTYMDCVLTIKGIEPYGAAVYASMWAAAALATGLSLRYTGSL